MNAINYQHTIAVALADYPANEAIKNLHTIASKLGELCGQTGQDAETKELTDQALDALDAEAVIGAALFALVNFAERFDLDFGKVMEVHA